MAANISSLLAGKHAFVSGASRGIGAAIAGELAKLGATVTLAARDIERLQENAVSINQQHEVKTTALALDLQDDQAIAEVANEAGPIDILVNNAGVAPSAPFEKQSVDNWRETFDINVTATFQLTQAFLPGMRQKDCARIVNIASTAGLVGYPYVAAYVASKHAVIGLTRSLALELAKTNITVNAVCPGYTETDMAAGAIANIARGGKTETEARAILARNNPQGRLIDPAEVAAAVSWLCLPGSSAITGQAISVAGGEVM